MKTAQAKFDISVTSEIGKLEGVILNTPGLEIENIGYRRNINTIEELDRKGFAIIDATDVAEKKVDLKNYDRCVITIDGSELSRGGGGCRCMTMPIRRKPV